MNDITTGDSHTAKAKQQPTLQALSDKLDEIQALAAIAAKPVLGIAEAAIFTGYTMKGIYELTSGKRIPHYKKNGRLYFRKDELEAWLTETKVLTRREIDSRAQTYVSTHR